jgi:hypothetical protein
VCHWKLRRKDATQYPPVAASSRNEALLPAFASFKGFGRNAGQTTADLPVQKSYRKDADAGLVAKDCVVAGRYLYVF